MNKPVILIVDEPTDKHFPDVEVKDIILVDDYARGANILMDILGDIQSMVRSCIIDMSNPVPKQYLHQPNAKNHGKRFEIGRQNCNSNNHWNNHRLQQRTRSVCGNRNASKGFQQAQKSMARV